MAKEVPKQLTPFKKGFDERRNLGGKRKMIITKILDDVGDDVAENGKTHKELIAEKLIEMAKKGDIRAIQLFIERTEGKEIQKVEIKDTSENPSWDVELV
jgi:hypothetical protein